MSASNTSAGSYAAGRVCFLEVKPDRILAIHSLGILLLTLAHLAVSWLHIETGRDHLLGLSSRLQFLTESSIPAFFSAVMLVAAAILAAVLARLDAGPAGRNRRAWGFITLLLLFMAVDEATAIHEVFNNLGEQQEADGMLFYAWVIPFGILALLCVLVLLPFWWRLPPPTKWGLATAACLFIACAIGLELIQSSLVAEAGEAVAFARWDFIALVTVEEAGEMLAVALAIRSLLHHLALTRGRAAALRLGLA